MKFIIGLENNGFQFMNDVIHYCQVTGHPKDPKIYMQIYVECMTQLFSRMEPDFQGYMLNLMELPDWRTIHYLDSPVNYEVVGPFRDAMRAMGIALWHRLQSRGNMDARYHYFLESCTETIAVVGGYISADTI